MSWILECRIPNEDVLDFQDHLMGESVESSIAQMSKDANTLAVISVVLTGIQTLYSVMSFHRKTINQSVPQWIEALMKDSKVKSVNIELDGGWTITKTSEEGDE